MKRRISLSICSALIATCVCGICSGCQNASAAIEGKYVSASGDKESYITLTDYTNKDVEYLGECRIQFTNVDLSIFEDYAVNNATANYVIVNDMKDSISDEEFKELKEQFSSNIDLEKQYYDNKALFEYGYSEEEKGYWMMSEIDGSGFDGKYECYVSMQYIPSEKSIVVNEKKYTLEENNE